MKANGSGLSFFFSIRSSSSSLQIALHPSLFFLLPSSQVSPGSILVLPQIASSWHALVHPSPLVVFASSHCSLPSIRPFPQVILDPHPPPPPLLVILIIWLIPQSTSLLVIENVNVLVPRDNGWVVVNVHPELTEIATQFSVNWLTFPLTVPVKVTVEARVEPLTD